MVNIAETGQKVDIISVEVVKQKSSGEDEKRGKNQILAELWHKFAFSMFSDLVIPALNLSLLIICFLSTSYKQCSNMFKARLIPWNLRFLDVLGSKTPYNQSTGILNTAQNGFICGKSANSKGTARLCPKQFEIHIRVTLICYRKKLNCWAIWG